MSTALALTNEERALLAECEETIEQGLDTFYEVGSALATVRDGQLYRETHGSFDAYCKERWGMSKTYANRLVSAKKVVDNLKDEAMTPTGVTQHNGPLPQTERHARPLTSLEPDAQREVWAQAVEQAAPEPVTSTQVRLAVSLRRRIAEAIAGTPVARQRDAIRLLERYHALQSADFFQTVLDQIQTGQFETVQQAFVKVKADFAAIARMEAGGNGEGKTFTVNPPMPLRVVPMENAVEEPDDTRPFPIAGTVTGQRASTIPWWLAEVAYLAWLRRTPEDRYLSLEGLSRIGGWTRRVLLGLLREGDDAG